MDARARRRVLPPGRPGGAAAYPVDARIVATSRVDLGVLASHGAFDAEADGTRLTSRVELDGRGLFGLLEPVIGAGLRREMKDALPALKAILERGSATR